MEEFDIVNLLEPDQEITEMIVRFIVNLYRVVLLEIYYFSPLFQEKCHIFNAKVLNFSFLKDLKFNTSGLGCPYHLYQG